MSILCSYLSMHELFLWRLVFKEWSIKCQYIKESIKLNNEMDVEILLTRLNLVWIKHIYIQKNAAEYLFMGNLDHCLV